MTHATRTLTLMLVAGMLFLMLGCGQQSNCNGASFGTTGGAGSGSSGNVSSGGSVCGGGSTDAGGGGGSNGAIADFMYDLSYDTTVSSPTTNIVQGASLTTAGAFANISGFNGPSFSFDSSQNMVIVNKQFLYIPQPTLNQIQAFAINRTTGALTAIQGSPFTTAGGSTVASDPQGHFLFVGSTSNGLISVFQINSTTGALTQNVHSPFPTTLLFSYFVNVDGQGKYLYVGQHNPSLPTGVFSIDPATGDLQSVGSFSLGVSGGSIASFNSGATEYYVAGSGIGGDNNLYVYTIDPATGIPSPVNGQPFPTNATPNFLAVHPSGQFLYVSEIDSSQAGVFEGFQLNSSTGAITAMSNSPFSNFASMYECQFDQSGANLFCVSSTGYTVLTIDPSTGAPTSTIPELQASPFVFAVTN